MSQIQKNKKADFIINTDQSMTQVEIKVLDIIKKVRKVND